MPKRIIERLGYDKAIEPAQEMTLSRYFQFSWDIDESAVLPYFASRFELLKLVVGQTDYIATPRSRAETCTACARLIGYGVTGDTWNVLWDGLPELIHVARGTTLLVKIKNTSMSPSRFEMVFGGWL